MFTKSIALASFVILVGCGGGGGDNTGRAGSADFKPDALTSTFKRISVTKAMKSIGLSEEANTGFGVKIGIIEDGLSLNTVSELKGHYGEGIDVKGNYDFKGNDKASEVTCTSYTRDKDGKRVKDPIADTDRCVEDHAMQVATIAAGKTLGVAPMATVIAYHTVGFDRLPNKNLLDTLNHARANKVIALNASWAPSTYIELGDRNVDLVKSGLESGLIDELKSADGNVENYPAWVFATGNTAKSNPSLYAAAPELIPELEKFWLAVTSVDGDGKLSYFSNMCGVAKDYCLSAAGSSVEGKAGESWVKTQNRNGKIVLGKGTSFAAPVVTGAFAVLAQNFSSITVREIRKRILDTASHTMTDGTKLKTRDGKSDVVPVDGKSDEFGRGVLRLDLALKPIGKIRTVYSGASLAQSQSHNFGASKYLSSPAFGAGVFSALSNINTVIFDEHDAPFDIKLSSYTPKPQQEEFDLFNFGTQPRSIALSSKTAFNYSNEYKPAKVLGFRGGKSATAKGMLGKNMSHAYVVGQYKMTSMFATDGDAMLQKIEKAFTYNGMKITPNFSMMYEKNSLLRSKGTGALHTDSSSASQFAGIDFDMKNKDFTLHAFATVGITKTNAFKSSMMQSLGSLKSKSMGLYVRKNNYGFGITAPLVVTDAPMSIQYVTARDKNKNLTYKTTAFNARPKAQQKSLEVFYEYVKTKDTLIKMSLHRTLNKNHTYGNNDTTLMFVFSKKF